MINQLQDSKIQISEPQFSSQELVRQILTIKYQQQQINNRAFQSLQKLMSFASLQMSSHKLKESFSKIQLEIFLMFSKQQEHLKKYYSMHQIIRIIQTVIKGRIQKHYCQPNLTLFRRQKKIIEKKQFQAIEKISSKEIKKNSRGSSSTSHSKPQKKERGVGSQIEVQEESSLMLQKIGHDLSTMIENLYKHTTDSKRFKVNLNSKFLDKVSKKQKKFKKMLNQQEISSIQPNFIPEYYDSEQIKSVLEYYGLKEPKSKKSLNKNKSKHCVKSKSKTKEPFIFVVAKKDDRIFERQRAQFSQISSPSQTRAEPTYFSPMTPTPRYLENKKQSLKQHSSSSKAKNKIHEKTRNSKLKKSRNSTRSKKVFSHTNLGFKKGIK